MANPNYQDRNSESKNILYLLYINRQCNTTNDFIAILYEYLQDQWMSCFGSCLIG